MKVVGVAVGRVRMLAGHDSKRAGLNACFVLKLSIYFDLNRDLSRKDPCLLFLRCAVCKVELHL